MRPFSLLVVSTRVGGVPEVLPEHMIRLAPVSASGLADTLAEAVEEMREQRIAWDHEFKSNYLSSKAVVDACAGNNSGSMVTTH